MRKQTDRLSFVFIAFIVVFSFSFNDAFAFSHTTQPNALASYNSANNQVSVDWDFSTLSADTRCLMKGDFRFDENVDVDEDDVITGFVPRFYSFFTSTPVILDAIDWHENSRINGTLVENHADFVAEEIPCTGSIRIDIDTVMNHPQNINNHPDIEIFLTFYVPNSDGNYETLNSLRIDEVLVLYSPIHTISTDTQNWFCDNQIGNVLYIDGSGIHGNNGDNCDFFVELEDNEYVDIVDGVITTTGFHTGSAPLLIEVIPESTPPIKNEKKSGGGCSGDCAPPTLGKNKNHQLIVTDGFGYNGHFVDVDKFHTDFPLITVNTNQTNNVTVKVYDNSGVNNIDMVQFGFGMPEVGNPLNDAQTLVSIALDNTEIEEITITEKYPLIDIDSILTDIVPCSDTFSNTKCLLISLDHTYRDQPKYSVVAVNTWDGYRYGQTNYFNDGVLVVGESMNEPLLDKVTASKGGALYPQRAGTVELTLVDYKTDTWQDKYGYLWTSDNYQSFKITSTIPVPIKAPDKIGSIIDRNHSEFYKVEEQALQRALAEFDASKLISELPAPILWEDVHPVINVELQELKIEYAKQVEAFNAEKYLMDLHPSYKKTSEKYQIEYDQLNKKYEDSLSLLLLQIKELE